MKFLTGCAAFVLAVCLASPTSAQFLKKLQQKAEQAGEKAVDKELGLNQQQQQQQQQQGQQGQNAGNTGGMSTNKSGGGLSQNQGGGGLISTPPDVKQNLSDAETAYKGGKYGEARYAVQQAMLGVELEIGNKVLKSLPETVSGLNKNPQEDQVTSTGYGWAGLTIVRKYDDGKDKDFRTTIANNAAWMSAVNMYLSSGGYAQQTAGQQNWKQTKVKGYRAIIEYSEGSGYKLSVPIGQSSLIIFEGVNFASENDMMSAANVFDIDGIKKMLGEQ